MTDTARPARRALFNALVAPLAGGPRTPSRARSMLDAYAAEVAADRLDDRSAAIVAGYDRREQQVADYLFECADQHRATADVQTVLGLLVGTIVRPTVADERDQALADAARLRGILDELARALAQCWSPTLADLFAHTLPRAAVMCTCGQREADLVPVTAYQRAADHEFGTSEDGHSVTVTVAGRRVDWAVEMGIPQ